MKKALCALRKTKLPYANRGAITPFAEIERFAKNCAALIISRVSARNQPIPVFLPKSAQNIVADIGILYSGNAYANLDIKSPPQRLKGMLQNLNPPMIVTSAAHVAALKALDIRRGQIALDRRGHRAGDELTTIRLLLKRLESVIDTDPYCIIHTSGSTGIPKGRGAESSQHD